MFGVVMLTPEQQRSFVREHPGVFEPVAGAWGAQGSTKVRLKAIDEEALGEALTLAWRNAVEKGPARTRSRATKRR
jgi:hypothetical protein